jgi:type IV pilus assembly protein PilC
LGVQLNAGCSISDSVQNAALCSGDVELKQISLEITPKLRRGMNFRDCISPFKSRLPELVFSLIEVGEISGSLVDSSQRLARTFKQTMRLQQEQKLKVYDPWLYLLGLCICDTIHEMLMQLGRTSPGPDMPLDSTAWHIALHVAIFALQLVVGYFFLRAVMPFVYRLEAIRIIVDTVKLALPGLGMVSRNLSASRWARSFAVLWSAGINISTALEISSRSALNIHYERAFMKAAGDTRRGRSLSESVAATELLPPHLLSIIRTCEISGRLDDQLLHMADQMEIEAVEKSIVEMNRIIYAIQITILVLAVMWVLGHASL